jgi:large subunit ribosomal protein L33
MAKKEVRIVIKLVSSESGHVYYSQKSKRNDPQRLELRKYDPVVRRHVMYKESK